MPEIVTRHLSNAPALVQPGFEFVFFNAFRTLSRQMESTTLSSTSRSAISCRVQRAAPVGASEQAIMAT